MNEIFNNNIKAILFDMDGVVIDSEKLYSQSEKKLLAQYGVKFDESDWHYIKGCTEKQFYDLVYSKFNINIPRDQLIDKGRKFLKTVFTQELEYMNGFNEIYSIFKKKFKLALVTSTGPELVNHIDSLLSIYEKFDIVITSKDTTIHKPQPEPYLIAMKRLQLEPNQCIVFEDSIQGIKAGKAAGSYVIALEGSLEKEVLTEADLIISSFYDLIK
tara:strand:- start:672 stop:1316 length:645 start_codon:yes stop_codon:yes gene_type:complete